MTSPLIDRLAREACAPTSDHEDIFSCECICEQITAALRAFQAEAAKVAREWRPPVGPSGHLVFLKPVGDEIAAKIEAL